MSDKEEPKKDPEKKKPKEKEKEKEEPTDDNWNESEFNKITDDGGVLKKILKDGIGSIPVEGNEVKINYEAKYQKALYDKNEDNKPLSVKIGAHQGIKGLEIAIKTMKVSSIYTRKCDY